MYHKTFDKDSKHMQKTSESSNITKHIYLDEKHKRSNLFKITLFTIMTDAGMFYVQQL